jgi:hypothetical protein
MMLRVEHRVIALLAGCGNNQSGVHPAIVDRTPVTSRHPMTSKRLVFNALLVVAVALLTSGGWARAQSAEPRAGFRVEGGEPHAGLPFVLSLIVEGLEETPAPSVPTLAIPNAKVLPMGATPNVSQSIQIINGRRIDSQEVRWVIRYRVEVSSAGLLKVPATTVVQGGKKATAPGGDVQVSAISATDDMKIELKLPDRPVWVGEVIAIEISWLLRRNAEDQTLVVPMLARDDQFLIAAPPVVNPRQALPFAAGARDFSLPFEQDQVDISGAKYTRFRFTFFASPRRAGKIEVAASSAVAALAVGRPDVFGQSATRLFRATDVDRVLEVKELPLSGRPDSFSGAVGSTFDLSSSASRSVVQLGEPVELTIVVRSDQRLDALPPPRLAGAGGLPSDRFTLPSDPPTGELSADGKTKTFKVAVQVIGPATEIPALAFSYFDPVKGGYQTTRSQPIALAVRGGTVVGAGDVVSATPRRAAATAVPGAPAMGESMAGADLVLSTPAITLEAPLGGSSLLAILALLYGLPIGFLLLRWWQRRTASQRGEAAEVRLARRRVEAELAKAALNPARESAGPLGESLRALARALQQVSSGTAIDRLETESYAPSAAHEPLSAELRSALSALVASWLRAGKERPSASKAATAATVLLLALLGAGRAAAAPAQSAPGSGDVAQLLTQARADYERAMQLPATQVSERRELFGRSESAFAEVVRIAPDRPELLVDWGNAALNSGNVATATLAYRRALLIDGEHPRAIHNLALLRSKHSDAYRASAASATGTLFFFHTWPRSQRWLFGAVAFAIAIMLLVSWRGTFDPDATTTSEREGRRRWARALSLVPFTVWAAMSMSLLLEDRRRGDAVVMDSVLLRAADSAGAPAAMSQPVPRGAEISVVSRRDNWVRIRLAGGNAGWVPASAVELIVAR